MEYGCPHNIALQHAVGCPLDRLSYDQDGDGAVRQDFHRGAPQQQGRKPASSMGTNDDEIAATIIGDIEDCSIGVLG